MSISNTCILKDERLGVIMGNGINETFFSGLTNLFAFSGIGYLYIKYILRKFEFK